MLVEILLVDCRDTVRDLRALDKHGSNGYGKSSSSDQAVDCELPRLLLLTGVRVNISHQEDDVGGGCNVEDLENEVPEIDESAEERAPEKVKIASTKDEAVEGLGEKRDSLKPLC